MQQTLANDSLISGLQFDKMVSNYDNIFGWMKNKENNHINTKLVCKLQKYHFNQKTVSKIKLNYLDLISNNWLKQTASTNYKSRMLLRCQFLTELQSSKRCTYLYWYD